MSTDELRSRLTGLLWGYTDLITLSNTDFVPSITRELQWFEEKKRATAPAVVEAKYPLLAEQRVNQSPRMRNPPHRPEESGDVVGPDSNPSQDPQFPGGFAPSGKRIIEGGNPSPSDVMMPIPNVSSKEPDAAGHP